MSSIKKNFIYNTIYQIFLIILPLITTPYISRILGAEQIGEFSYNYSVAVIFVMFSALGLSNYGNRTIAENKDSQKKLSESFWNIYAMQFVSSLIVIALYIIYLFLINNTQIATIMLIHVLSGVFDINWLFFGLEKFKMATIRSVAIKLLMTVCVFIFVKTSDDLPVYSLIICLSSILSQIILWPYVINKIGITKVEYKKVVKHIKPNLVLFIPVIAIGIYRYMDKVMLGLMSTNAEVGFYENSDKIINLPMALITSLGTVMLPRVSNLLVQKKVRHVAKYMEKSIGFAMFISSSMCFGIMAVSKSFVPLYFGNGFEKCSSLFYVLLPSCLFLAFANVIRTQYLIPNKKDKIYVTSIIIGALTNILFNLLLIPSLASIGAAIGTLFAQISVCIYQAYKTRKELHIKHYVKEAIPFILSGGIMFTALLFTNNTVSSLHPIIQIALDIIAGAVIYIIALFGLSKLFRINYLEIFRIQYYGIKRT